MSSNVSQGFFCCMPFAMLMTVSLTLTQKDNRLDKMDLLRNIPIFQVEGLKFLKIQDIRQKNYFLLRNFQRSNKIFLVKIIVYKIKKPQKMKKIIQMHESLEKLGIPKNFWVSNQHSNTTSKNSSSKKNYKQMFFVYDVGFNILRNAF